MSYVPLVGYSVYPEPCVSSTPKLKRLTTQINDIVRQERQMRHEFGQQYAELIDEYNAEIQLLRPVFPSEGMKNAIRTALHMINQNIAYGDHLGYPTQAQLDAGRPALMQHGVGLRTDTGFLHLRMNSPFIPNTAYAAWELSDAEIESAFHLIKSLGYDITDTWRGPDWVSTHVSRSQSHTDTV